MNTIEKFVTFSNILKYNLKISNSTRHNWTLLKTIIHFVTLSNISNFLEHFLKLPNTIMSYRLFGFWFRSVFNFFGLGSMRVFGPSGLVISFSVYRWVWTIKYYQTFLNTFGDYRTLSGTISHYRKLSDTIEIIGHYRTLLGTIGHYQTLPNTTRHYWKLSNTIGHNWTLSDTIGNYQTLPLSYTLSDTVGHYDTL